MAWSPKQYLFVDEYLKDLNAHQAALRAGYSPKSAQRIGLELLAKTHVAAAIAQAQRDRSQRTQIDADRVLRELARLAFVDIRRLYDDAGRLKRPGDLDDDTAAALASVEIDELAEYVDGERQHLGFTKKVRVWNKVASLKLLGQHLKLFAERVEHTGKDGGPLIVEHVRYGEDSDPV